MKTIRLAFSPDSDDAFMFWPLLNQKVTSGAYTFEAQRADTETLNAWAQEGRMDVIAISMAQYLNVAQDYLLLPHGASVGRGYGPVIVAPQARTLDSLQNTRIAVPGLRTTAYMVTRLLVPAFEPVVVPIVPYEAVFGALRQGRVDAAVLIHEGRLLYEREGFAKVADLGEAWAARTAGLPLPLGGNAIHRRLGDAAVAEISDICRESIRWALAHKDQVMDALMAEDPNAVLGRKELETYLSMYANDDTLNAPNDVKRGLEVLFEHALHAGLVAQAPAVLWAP